MRNLFVCLSLALFVAQTACTDSKSSSDNQKQSSVISSQEAHAKIAAGPQGLECSSEPSGENNYLYSISMDDSNLNVQQSSDNGRYPLIHHSIEKEDKFSASNDESAKFSCSVLAGDLTSTIEVFSDKVIVQKSSSTGKYPLVSYKILKDNGQQPSDDPQESPSEILPVEECETLPTASNQYMYSIKVSGENAEVAQQSTTGRYPIIKYKIRRDSVFKAPAQKSSKFECKKSDGDKLVEIQVYEDQVIIKKSSTNG